jgi:hypothetical protein
MVRIEHYTAERIADPEGNASWEDFLEARNAIVCACRLHGPTGPMGIYDFDKADGTNDLFDIWETGDPGAVYFVAEDQYNSERYQYVGCSDHPSHFTKEWILDLMAALAHLPGWRVEIGVHKAYVLVFADKLMVTGRCFEDVNDLPTLISNAQYALLNKHLDPKAKSGACKDFYIKDDRLVCTVDYGDNVTESINIDRESVKKVWRIPYWDGWMLSLKAGNSFELPNETAFAKISEWFQSSAD